MQSALTIRAGIFESEPAAERAVLGLLAAGFSREWISVVSTLPFPHHVEHPDVRTVPPSGSHTRGALVLGGTIGSVLGGLLVFLTNALSGDAGLHSLGPLLVGAAAGALSGGFLGAMLTRGFEPSIADFFDQALSRGQYLVAVEESTGSPPLDVAESVFEHAGAAPVPLRKG